MPAFLVLHPCQRDWGSHFSPNPRGSGDAKMFACFIKEDVPVVMLESTVTSQISILLGIGWT